jgi:hypothetical protein
MELVPTVLFSAAVTHHFALMIAVAVLLQLLP